jgi:putative ABC transport system permease protein
MSWPGLRSVIRGLIRRRQVERETEDELRFHLEARTDDLMARRKLSRDEAVRQSRIEFGGVEQYREKVREARGFRAFDDFCGDLRYAFRQVRRNPTFAAVAIVTLALGIGANTTIFSLVNAILLQPLPYKDSDRLISIIDNIPGAESRTGAPERRSGMNPEEFQWWRMRTTTLSDMALRMPISMTLTRRDETIRLPGTRVSPAMFPMLRIQPILGRVFEPSEEKPGADSVVILSYGAWQTYFEADPKILGRPVMLDRTAYLVVGVMPRGFMLPSVGDSQAMFWTPLTLTVGPSPILGLPVMARLKEGVTVEAAAKDADTIARELRGDPPTDPHATASGPPRTEIVPVKDELVAPIRSALYVFVVAVGLVLLIACVNVANLFLARATSRHQEITIRLALGAGRSRILRQLLTESLALALIGGAAGCALAVAGIQFVKAFGQGLARLDLAQLGDAGNTIPRLDEASIDSSVLLCSLVITVVMGVVFGLSPALLLRRIDLSQSARPRAGSAFGHGLRSARPVLVVNQIALTMVLLLGAGLLIRSFVKLTRVDLGYDPANVLTFQIAQAQLPRDSDSLAKLDLPGIQRFQMRRAAFAEQVVTRLQVAPGIHSAAFTTALPMVNGRYGLALRTTPAAPTKVIPGGNALSVSRDYLRVMGIRVIAGRGFNENDRVGPRPLLVNRTLAKEYFGELNPIGKRVYLWGDPIAREIVGVVNDMREFSLFSAPEPQLFIDAQEAGGNWMVGFQGGLYFALRTTLDAGAIVPQIRGIVRQLDPQAALGNIATMDQIVANSITQPRMYAVVPGIFAAIAVALAAIGIYGVMAYSVAQRTQEIGVRMALGAQRWQVLFLILRQGLAVTILGMIVGLAGGVAVTRYLEKMLFGLTPLDPITFLVVPALFTVVTFIACYLPGRSATKVDPLVALRYE